MGDVAHQLALDLLALGERAVPLLEVGKSSLERCGHRVERPLELPDLSRPRSLQSLGEVAAGDPRRRPGCQPHRPGHGAVQVQGAEEDQQQGSAEAGASDPEGMLGGRTRTTLALVAERCLRIQKLAEASRSEDTSGSPTGVKARVSVVRGCPS